MEMTVLEFEWGRLALHVAAGGRKASRTASLDECAVGERSQCGVEEGVRVQFSPAAGSP